MDPTIVSALSSYGLPGLAILLLLGVVRHLFKRFDDVQEARIKDAAATASALRDNTAALATTNKLIEAQVARIDMLSAALNRRGSVE